MMKNKSREAVAFRDYLNDEEENELAGLILKCNEFDHTSYSFPEAADCYGLLYFDGVLCSATALFGMGAESGGKSVDELIFFTDPDLRKRGFCRKLYEELENTYETAEVKRFAVYKNAAAESALKAFGAEYTHDECIMTLEFGSKDDVFYNISDEDRNKLSLKAEMSINDGICDFKYGSCSFKLYADRAYIYAVLVYERYRSKGFGLKLMYTVLEHLRKAGVKACFLEVDSSNIPAYELYKKIGFSVNERLSYYENISNLE